MQTVRRRGMKFFTMAIAPILQVTRVALANVTGDATNPRRRGSAASKAIAASLQKHGQVKPLVLRSLPGGGFSVVDGHGRLGAMREAGWTHADATVLDLSAQKARAVGITLNRTAELADWDLLGLAGILDDLTEAGFDALEAGFSSKELEALEAFAKAPHNVSDDESLPVPAELDEALDRFANEEKTQLVFRLVVSASDTQTNVKKKIQSALKEAGFEGFVLKLQDA